MKNFERPSGMPKKTDIQSLNIFGRRLTTRLNQIGETQAWLAGEMKLSNNAISKWCTGDGGPTFGNLLKAAKIMKCSPGYLAGDDEDETAAEAVRIIMEIDPESRPIILAGITAVAATLPKAKERKRA